ncbi:DNA gyrase subunit A [Taibaiella sp. KBW10]|uniref:DNA gyrase subunit A n=1 Tax=Taibaiella sp. KBW10 TaxID=2153357 RepID=UPI000F59349A|nr:DNA gyrase subunit A [Taibaiella sp. KBW10]RQO31202.1 DNA gyrase subunit A [Taibaiella sp. KBW10]
MSDNTNEILPNEGGENEPQNRIVAVNIEEQMKSAYIDYSMSVIVGRALPDVRDGLKPVHRRVLYAMNELSMAHNKPHKKSARVVGEVLGKYHPHGDSSVYDAMVRMAQPWSMRYMMVDGQGNFGSQDGDGPAAMRYTEVRMQRYAESMIEDIEKETVDFGLNFDDSLEEPTVLPTRIPQLLVNGSSGIAVGMATNIMPHNLTEVINGCIAYIENKEITIDELMHYVKAPDFPTGGIIYGIDGIKQGFQTGRGRVVLRGRVTVETLKNGKDQIVITEVPYQVSRDALAEKIGYLVNNKIIDGITHVANESNKEGTRVVVELRRDAVAQVIINQLYKYSELQTSYGINNVALVKGRPRTLNLKDMISEFVAFRHEVVTKRTQYELREAEKRAHILEGYMKVVGTQNDLDRAIKIIRESKTPDEAREGLMTSFDLSEIQAKAILELRLRTLTGLEIDKIRSEYDELMKTINHLKGILADESIRFDIIKGELLEVQKKFGDERRTEIQYASGDMRIEDMIAEEDVVITISHLGYIKRASVADYRSQKRGGRGAMGGKTRDEDYLEHLFIASTHDTLLFFTEKGRCYWLKVYEIPETDKNAKGRAIQNLMQIPQDDKIRVILDVPKLDDEAFVDKHNIVLCTKKGIIKKTKLKEFSRPRQTGVNAITINEGDQLLDVALTDGESFIMMAIKSGRAISFNEDRVRATGRGAIGVSGIELEGESDAVVGMICLSKDFKDRDRQVLVVSEKGLGKRTPFFELIGEEATDEDKEKAFTLKNEDGSESLYQLSYRITNRGGKGVKTMNITDKTGPLAGLLSVTQADDLMITCQSGLTIRMKVESVREAGRATQGVKLINIDNKDQIAAIARIQDQGEEEEIIEEGDVVVSTDPEGTNPTATEEQTPDANNEETPDTTPDAPAAE